MKEIVSRMEKYTKGGHSVYTISSYGVLSEDKSLIKFIGLLAVSKTLTEVADKFFIKTEEGYIAITQVAGKHVLLQPAIDAEKFRQAVNDVVAIVPPRSNRMPNPFIVHREYNGYFERKTSTTDFAVETFCENARRRKDSCKKLVKRRGGWRK